MAKAPPRPVIFSNPYFKLLLIINSLICLGSFGAVIVTAIYGNEPPTKAQERLLEISVHAFTTTVGLFVGLLGGRAAAPDRTQ